MGGLFGGGGTQGFNQPRLGALNVQGSTYGLALPIVYGSTRIPINIIWYGDLVSVPQTSSQGGKGGSSQTTGYSYSAAIAMGLCEGQIAGIGNIWVDKIFYQPLAVGSASMEIDYEQHVVTGGQITVLNSAAFISDIGAFDSDKNPIYTGYTAVSGVYIFSDVTLEGQTVYISYLYNVPAHTASPLEQLALTLFPGSKPQTAWGYLTSKHPDQAVSYPGVAYLASGSYPLSDQATLGNHNVEILGALQFGGGVVDCDPSAVIADYLTNVEYGANFPAGQIGVFTQFRDYTVSAGFFISPAFTSQDVAATTLQSIFDAVNCVPFYSENKLKVVPRGDKNITGNGATFVPNLTPEYDLTDDDFIAAMGDDPITVTRKSTADSYNDFQVEFLNRGNQYNVQIAETKDQANIEKYGLIPSSALAAHFICDQGVAANVAETMLQRSLYIRNQYEFKLGWNYCLLEPMDIVTLTDTGIGLNRFPVRILKIVEDQDETLTITAEELQIGAASAPKYSTQIPAGYVSRQNDLPGNANTPVIFIAPAQLANNNLEAWIIASGGANWGGCDVWVSTDRQTYALAGTITGSSRHGRLTANIDSAPTSTLSIALDNTTLQLLSATPQDAANLTTLCYADGELLAYTTATLTGAGAYNLTGLIRGAYGTNAGAHLSGSEFARLDNTVFKYPFGSQLIGQAIFVKLVSFNLFGLQKQTLDEVSPYSVALSAPASGDVINLTHSVVNNNVVLAWDQPNTVLPINYYSVSVGTTYAGSTQVAKTAALSATIASNAPSSQNYWVTPVDVSGAYGTPVSVSATAGSSFMMIDTVTGTKYTPVVVNGDMGKMEVA